MSEQPAQEHDEPAYESDSEDEWLRKSDEPAASNATPTSSAAVSAVPKKKLDEVFSWNPEEQSLAGNKVRVFFTLPGGERVGPEIFFMGLTVAHLKTRVEEAHGIPYEKQVLLLAQANGTDLELLDPLSLNDLPFDAATDNNVTVKLS